MYSMLSPTKQGVRSDREGLGYFGTPRRDRTHTGVDFLCEPGKETYSPISGTIVRVAYPYENYPSLSGVFLQNSLFQVKLFYTLPIERLIGEEVTKGERIGFNQDVRIKYPLSKGMQPHVHMQLKIFWQEEWLLADPLMFITL